MKPVRPLSRRSFLARVAGGAVAGGGALVLLSGKGEAVQVTDRDTGPNSDPPNRAVTDADSAPNSDPPNRGRGRARSVCTDSDSGPNSDGVGRGRGTGVSDADSGGNSDAPSCGRGPAHR
ncbi:MAG TPA: twin-arginine translocation signal domain-containing protein [Allosphingosinicella sp.]|jgi:hypothetical protein